MTREEHNNLEENYKHATPVLIGCFLVALSAVFLFLFFFSGFHP